MTEGFSDPIVGGGGALVYASIHSPNFAPGPPAVGWSIDKNGNATFGSLTLSGTFTGDDWILDATGFFLYSGTPAAGNLSFSVTPLTTTADGFGNKVISGATANYGATIAVAFFNGEQQFYEGSLSAGWTLETGFQWDTAKNQLDLGGILQVNAIKQGAGWQSVTIPASWTGSARVKLLAEQDMALFDCDITAPAGGATSGSFGTLPAGYYPLDERIAAAGFTGATAGTNARLIINASPTGPSFAGLPAGFTGSLQMTVPYPLD